MNAQSPPSEGSPVNPEDLLGSANPVALRMFEALAGTETEEVPDDQGAAPADDAGVGAEGAEGTPETPVEPAASGTPEATDSGVEGEPGVQASPVEPQRAVVTPEVQPVVDNLSNLGTAFEERLTVSFQEQAMEEFQDVYENYIETLDKHPLELVGQEVPALNEEGTPTVYNTTEQVKDYQEALKVVLGRLLRQRVDELREEVGPTADVVHSSITLFQNNPDLIPGTAGFNKDLADQVARLVKPYELKMDGKLTGYNIDIQGIVDQARGQLTAAPATPAPAAKKSAPAKKSATPPQGGIASRAGKSGEGEEDYTAFWKEAGFSSIPI